MPSRTQSRAQRGRSEAPGEQRAVVVFDQAAQKDAATKLVAALDARQDQILSFLGSDPKVADRFLTVAVDAIVRDPNVLQADLMSLVASVRHAAIMGLEPTSVMGEGAIVVYRDNDQGGKKVAQFQPMVRGLSKLARNSGQVRAIGVDVVRRNDHFEFRSGSNPEIVHEPYIKGLTGDEDPGDVIGAYAYAKLDSGELVPLYMSLAEIEKRRRISKSWQNSGEKSIWGQWPEEMMKKTVLRRLLVEKVPLSPRAMTALALDAEIDSATGKPERVEDQAKIGSRTRARLASGILDDAQDGSGDAEKPEAATGATDEANAAPEPSEAATDDPDEGDARAICGRRGMTEGSVCILDPHATGPHRDSTGGEWL